MRIRPEKIRYESEPSGSGGTGSAALVAGILTLGAVVGSAFLDTDIGGGGYLLLTVPLSPVIFGVVYVLLRRSL